MKIKNIEKKEEPEIRFNDNANILLNSGELNIGDKKFKIKSIEQDENTKLYKCIISENFKKINYSHVKEAKTKLESVIFVLEHLEMMGYGGLSTNSSNTAIDDLTINPLDIKKERKKRKKKNAVIDAGNEETKESDDNSI